MFKKLLTLVAAAAVCINASADVKEVYSINYGASGWNFYVMGYTPEVVDGVLVSNNPMNEAGDEPAWYQYFIADGIPTSVGENYTMVMKAKASEEVTINVNMGWGWGDGQQIGKPVTIGTDWEEIEVEYPEVGGASCNLVAQPGTTLATIYIEYVKVVYVDDSKPVEWENLLVNGDAEGEYGDIPCAYAKINYGDFAGEPQPASIEVVDGSKVFAVHAGAVEVAEDGSHAWANQFWIQAPKAFKTGDIFKVSFRYKASQNANTNTQAHRETPGSYLHWALLGDVAFTTDWQQYSREIAVDASQNGMWSAAFNLNAAVTSATDFYFDDLKWEVMKLDEGWFVATDKAAVDDAIEMVWNEEQNCYEAIVGEKNYVSQVLISTVRGNRSAFLSNTLKVVNEINSEDWMDYQTGTNATIILPEEGTWLVQVDPEMEQICFTLLSETGITSVDADSVTPVYYNLQGVKVQNPAKGGIYIVKRGDKVSKIIR